MTDKPHSPLDSAPTTEPMPLPALRRAIGELMVKDDSVFIEQRISNFLQEVERCGWTLVLQGYIDSLRRQAARPVIETLARAAETQAASYEVDAANCDVSQVRIVPEPQLSRLKAKHWRTLAQWIRRESLKQPQGGG